MPNRAVAGTGSKAVGGVIVIGGGLALYDGSGKIVGGLGLSGDTSCRNHIIAWKLRDDLHLDHVPMTPSPAHDNHRILDYKNQLSPGAFGHPDCKGGNEPSYITQNRSKDFRTGAKMKWFAATRAGNDRR